MVHVEEPRQARRTQGFVKTDRRTPELEIALQTGSKPSAAEGLTIKPEMDVDNWNASQQGCSNHVEDSPSAKPAFQLVYLPEEWVRGPSLWKNALHDVAGDLILARPAEMHLEPVNAGDQFFFSGNRGDVLVSDHLLTVAHEEVLHGAILVGLDAWAKSSRTRRPKRANRETNSTVPPLAKKIFCLCVQGAGQRLVQQHLATPCLNILLHGLAKSQRLISIQESHLKASNVLTQKPLPYHVAGVLGTQKSPGRAQLSPTGRDAVRLVQEPVHGREHHGPTTVEVKLSSSLNNHKDTSVERNPPKSCGPEPPLCHG